MCFKEFISYANHFAHTIEFFIRLAIVRWSAFFAIE